MCSKSLTIRPWRGPRCGSLASEGHRRPPLCGRWHGTQGILHRRWKATSCGCGVSYCGLFCWHARRWARRPNASHDDCAWNAGGYTCPPYHCPLKDEMKMSAIVRDKSNFKWINVCYFHMFKKVDKIRECDLHMKMLSNSLTTVPPSAFCTYFSPPIWNDHINRPLNLSPT